MRQPDKQTTARVMCEQRRVNVTELPSGAIHFRGHDLDLMVPSWADLNLGDLTSASMHVEAKRQSRHGLA